MTRNRFGGPWTEEKLDVLREYINFYTIALKNSPTPSRPFRLVYIDAFAGTGHCKVRAEGDDHRTIPGSACIALDNALPFSRYHFIEPQRVYLRELQELVGSHPHASRATVHPGKAQERLPTILGQYDWRIHRAVLFLDPFGLQCDWDLLKQVRETEAVDVFFLLSVSGLFRNAARAAGAIDGPKAAALTRVLGTDEWRSAWYDLPAQRDMFDPPSEEVRQVDWRAIVEFSTRRLRSLFPFVLDPKLLLGPSNVPLFALYLAVSNPSPVAGKLATAAGKDILNKLR